MRGPWLCQTFVIIWERLVSLIWVAPVAVIGAICARFFAVRAFPPAQTFRTAGFFVTAGDLGLIRRNGSVYRALTVRAAGILTPGGPRPVICNEQGIT